MKYRVEIDGLRAISVISVVLFHFGLSTFSGGYVGVDIFFVISGYLITSIILKEIHQDSFSLANFYVRRARRILPVLFFMLLVSSLISIIVLLPNDLYSFCKSLLSVNIYASNFYFWRESGYWAVANDLKPLLHTWSLAVEEQYYIFFPLFLLICKRLKLQYIFIFLIIILLSSLGLSQWGAYAKPSANFYLLPTRAWELAIGACLTLVQYNFPIQLKNSKFTKYFSDIVSLVGLVFISYSIFLFDEETPFPSCWALLPTLGASLVILFSSRETIIGRVLGNKILVSIGLISYSLYLWHQPVLALYRSYFFLGMHWYHYLTLFIIIIILSYISYYFVEKPFRDKNNFSDKQIVYFCTSFTLVFILFAIVGIYTEGFSLYSSKRHQIFTEYQSSSMSNSGLSLKCDGNFPAPKECWTDPNPEVLVWGDSFAMHLVPALLASDPNIRLVQMTKSACGPFFDIAPVSVKFPADQCLSFNHRVKSWLSDNRSVKYVIMSSPFEEYLSKGAELLDSHGNKFTSSREIIYTELMATLTEIKLLGAIPVLVSPTPGNGLDLGRCVARAKYFYDDSSICNFDPASLMDYRQTIFSIMDEIELSNRVIRLDKLLCDAQQCHALLDDTPIYRDRGHLSHEGARLIGKKYNLYQMMIHDSNNN
ncbi:acyltransferase family protein [Desulfogranum japonicum]|uniref:acyltransferase family protein n=1 Tax=Desulfogranum japonicum TaxID=231447 RepID=UPI000401010A|nr:acyltransferase family protein [Desulfogranum japonicum]